MRVAGELERNPFLGRNRYMVRRMSEQYAWAVAVDTNGLQDRPEMFRVSRIVIGHSNELKTIDLDLVPVQNSNAGA